jgi:membrane protein implicated in regulation of membrane protease activity
MSNMWVQGLMWVVAATLLLVYLKRRRNRKMLP